MSRVRYQAGGALKDVSPRPFHPLAQLCGLGRSVFFPIPCPCPRSVPCRTHTPDRSTLKIGGNKQGAVHAMNAGGPSMAAGLELPK